MIKSIFNLCSNKGCNRYKNKDNNKCYYCLELKKGLSREEIIENSFKYGEGNKYENIKLIKPITITILSILLLIVVYLFIISTTIIMLPFILLTYPLKKLNIINLED